MGNRWNIFRLTDPPGLDIIKNCQDRRPFHPHEVDDSLIYEKAYLPGHVEMSSALSCEVQDQRWD